MQFPLSEWGMVSNNEDEEEFNNTSYQLNVQAAHQFAEKLVSYGGVVDGKKFVMDPDLRKIDMKEGLIDDFKNGSPTPNCYTFNQRNTTQLGIIDASGSNVLGGINFLTISQLQQFLIKGQSLLVDMMKNETKRQWVQKVKGLGLKLRETEQEMITQNITLDGWKAIRMQNIKLLSQLKSNLTELEKYDVDSL